MLRWDILVVGTALNVVVGFVALMALASAATHLAVGLHFAMLPYNLFLVACLWRAPHSSPAELGVAGIWLLLLTLA